MSVRKALLFSYLEKYGSYLVALASTVVISRLLSPADIGAFAVGMALVGLIAVFREFGISTYLVQETELTQRRISAAFTLTVGIGLSLAVLVAALAMPASSFYGDPRIETILLILAAGFAVTPLGGISQALLMREMRFEVLAWVRLMHSVTSATVGVLLAWRGHGPASLAWAALAAAALNSAVSLAVRPHSLRTTLHSADLRRVMRVGLPATLVSIVDDLINTVPDLIVGRWQGLAAAGLLSRARGLSQMAHQLIARAAAPVFLSAFAERRREGVGTSELYSNATACVCAVGWTLLATLGVLADPVVRVLFGAQWNEVGPLLRWLCASAAALLLTSGAHILLLAHDGASDALRARLWALPLYLACGVVGALVSVQAMVAATMLASVAASGLLMRAVRVRVGISVGLQLHALQTSWAPPTAAAIGALPAAWWYTTASPPAILAAALGSLAAATAAGAVVSMSDNPLRREVRKALNLRRARAGSQGAPG